MSTEVNENEQIDKYTTAAAVAHAISGQPLEFEKATQHILAAKVQDAIDLVRQDVANRMFGAPSEDQAEVETETDEVEQPESEEPETPEET